MSRYPNRLPPRDFEPQELQLKRLSVCQNLTLTAQTQMAKKRLSRNHLANPFQRMVVSTRATMDLIGWMQASKSLARLGRHSMIAIKTPNRKNPTMILLWDDPDHVIYERALCEHVFSSSYFSLPPHRSHLSANRRSCLTWLLSLCAVTPVQLYPRVCSVVSLVLHFCLVSH